MTQLHQQQDLHEMCRQDVQGFADGIAAQMFVAYRKALTCIALVCTQMSVNQIDTHLTNSYIGAADRSSLV